MRLKKNFYTGLLMILPVVITYYIFNWLFNLAFRIINNTAIIKVTKLVFFSKFIKKASDVLERIPIIKTVYSTSKQIIGVVYSGDGESVYKKVVAVEFPRKGIYAIGFITADKNTALKEFLADKEIVNVFVPTAPNPTSGFLLCMPKEDIHPLNMSVEWAFKLIVSGGYITEELVKEKEEDKITE